MAKINVPRDLVLYLLKSILIFITAIGAGIVWFGIVNYLFFDAAQEYSSSWSYVSGQIKGGLSSIFVAGPLLLLNSWFLRKELVAHPERKDFWVRRWLSYITLFVASIVIVVDLITLVNYFLDGELTTRFVLKVLIVLGIAGFGMGYHAWDLKQGEKKSKTPYIFSGVTALLLLATIVSAFSVIGSPKSQREINLNYENLRTLTEVSNQVRWYAQAEDDVIELPASLTQVYTDRGMGDVPQSPIDNSSYEYRVIDAQSFEMCTTFTMSSIKNYGGYHSSELQTFSEGRNCFTLNVKKGGDLKPVIR